MTKPSYLKKNIAMMAIFGMTLGGSAFAQGNLDKAEIKADMVAALEWQEAHPIFAAAPTDWTNGAYYTGVARAHRATNDMMYMAALKTAGYNNDWNTYDRIYHADDIAISYSYLYVDMTEKRKGMVDLAPTTKFINEHLYVPNQWSNPAKKGGAQDILWWWCDALFMAPPVITLYAKHTGDNSYLEAMHKFYMESYDKLYDKEEHLFARDARYVWTGSDKDEKEANGKKIFWSRGNGWVLAGLALILEDLPSDYEHRDFYEKLYQDMAARILELQDKDGLWRTSLLSPESFDHGEVSGSGFYTFAFAWGINNGLLDQSTYLPSVKKAWTALAECQHEDGRVGWVQNIGASPEPASQDSWQNFGTGAFLMAGSEVIQLLDN